MVVAAWSGTRPGFQEVVDHGAVDGFPVGDVMFAEVAVEEAQRGGFGPVLAIQCLLELQKLTERICQVNSGSLGDS